MTRIGALSRALLAGLLLSALEIAVAAPLAHRLMIGSSEWRAFVTASLPVTLTLSLVFVASGRLVWALLPKNDRRETWFAALLALAASGWGATALTALTAGRRLVSSPARAPIVILGALLMAWATWWLRGCVIRTRQSGGSWRIFGALALLALALLEVDQRWLVHLYPALHLLLAFGAAVAVVAAVFVAPTPRSFGRRLLGGRWLWVTVACSAPLLAPLALRALATAPNAAYAVIRSAPYTGKVVAHIPTPAAPLALAIPMAESAGRHGLDLRAQPDVLLITVDALRADRLRSYGGVGLTPEMDALASSGFVFERAYTTTPHTSYALSSLMTAKYLRPLYELGGASTSQPTVAATLRRFGYRTAAFYPPAIFFVDGARFGDFRERGFDFEYRKAMFLDARQRPAQLEAWLAQVPADHPAFAWVHLFEPHEPYGPPVGYASGTSDLERYDGEVRVADEAVGELVRTFRRWRPGATVILTADHGEEFGDHGGRYHGTTLYDEQIRVPLIWSSPGAVAPTTSAAPVELVDVVTTLLSALAIPADARMRGDDLGALLLGDETAAPPFAFADIAHERFVTDGRLAALCATESSRCRLYDLVNDPGEQRNLAAERPADLLRLRGAIAGFAASVPRVEALALGGEGAWPEALTRAALGDASQAPDLVELLHSERAEVRAKAARELARFAYAPAREPLLRLAESDGDANVRAEAATAAYRLGERSLADDLALLTLDVGAERARRAALALAESGDGRGRDVLLALMADTDTDENERLLAITALSQIGGAGVRHALVSLLPDVRLRTPAARALSRLGDPEAIPALYAALTRERYLPAREAEARALWSLGDRRVKRLVRRFLGMDVPMPGGVQLLAEMHALRSAHGGVLVRDPRVRVGAFACGAAACMAGDGARLRLPRHAGGERLVLWAEAPEGGGAVTLGTESQPLPAGAHELGWTLPDPATRSLSLSATPGVQLVAFVVVPAQEEIPPPPPEPWRDAGLD